MIIVDRRAYSRGKSDVNKQRFIERHNHAIKQAIDELVNRTKLGDLGKTKEETFTFNGTEEPSFSLVYSSGNTRKRVWVNNQRHYRGDLIWMRNPEGSDGGEEGEGTNVGNGGGGDDLFHYTMTRNEFLDLYFSDLELPNYTKEGIKKDKNKKLVRCGYSKDGIPARLNLRKTFENAIARRISAKRDPEKKPRWLDDEDLRYNYFDLKEFPIKHAVMICCMDVSGSMGEERKRLAKKFYTLLYVFLLRTYDSVDLIFIRHADEARECSEHEFFHGTDSGGTMIEPALTLINSIIEARYDVGTTNIYVAQTSDGDTYAKDTTRGIELIKNKLIDKLQYFAYIQMKNRRPTELGNQYARYAAVENKFNMGWVDHANELFAVFSKLFAKR